jgi:uncharacterized membrane protein YphA (DoxX/SURF4 family)
MTLTPAFHVNVSWGLRILLVVIFFAAATAKIAGVPMMVQIFAQIGLGQWFPFVTAGVEIAGAGALVIPGLTGVAAIWLGTTMFFAILVHLFVMRNNPGGAVALFVLSVSLAWLMRDQLLTLRDRLL